MRAPTASLCIAAFLSLQASAAHGAGLDGATGNICKADLERQTFELLKETEYNPQTGVGASRFTVYWTGQTTITQVVEQTSFAGIQGPVIADFHGIDDGNSKALAEGKPFEAREAILLPRQKTATGVDASQRQIVSWFSPDPGKAPLSGTIEVNGKQVKVSLRKRNARICTREPLSPADIAKGFWKTTIHGTEVGGRFVIRNMEVEPLIDPRAVDDPKLPRVLVVGDSISMNYHEAAKSALRGVANYYRIEGNSFSTVQGVRNMELWLGNYQEKGLHWDVIQFNHGLHDLKQPYDAATGTWGAYAVPLKDYQANLEQEIALLKRTGARLIWCTTTPVPNDNKGPYARRKGAEQEFNQAALEVMRRHPEIQVNDLCRLVNDSPLFDNWRKQNDVHFRPAEQTVLGEAVARAISQALENTIPLAGTWRFRLDPKNLGVGEKWFAEKLGDSVTLPGTTDTNQKGVFKDEHAVDRLSRVWYWKGPAWYQREVVIPEAWQGKRITLLLERTKNTRVWVDDKDCGAEDTLSAPQVFDLTAALTPGKHTLTVLVDNGRLPPIGESPHALDERTQSNWNGIIGRIELRATDRVWLDNLQVYPDVDNHRATIRAVIGNLAGGEAAGTVTVAGESWNTPGKIAFPAQSMDIHAPTQGSRIEFTYRFGQEVPLWDEFNPAMIRFQVTLYARVGGERYRDTRLVDFGMRKFARDGQRLTINGRTLFLRGRVDSCIFPATGYPPMDREEWIRLFRIAKSYGLNHQRFHSWFPPEAALEAADEVGLYLEPELPNKRSNFGKFPESKEAAIWNIDYLRSEESASQKDLSAYLKREGELIFKYYGNHPSFTMFTLGNELGRNEAMYEMVAHFRKADPRRLYAQGTGNMHWAPSFPEGDDFWITCKTGKDLPVRGAFFSADYPYGHIDYRPPSTLVDYTQSIKDVPAPVISHEIAEFEVSPDFREIPKYTGVLKARNLEIFRQRLQDAHMLDLADDFVRASGALSVICHREEIEAALRTPGFDGFQLLDLVDFSGQGTALVGMLNVFMESKGFIQPDRWRQFCCPTVPLVLFEKYTWTTNETFAAAIKIAHYGAADIPNARVAWSIGSDGGPAIASGALGPMTIRQGEVFPAGQLAVPLGSVTPPRKLVVTAAIEGTPYRNQYDLWVYPQEVDTRAPMNVLVTDRLDAAAQKHLEDGGKVLLFPRLAELPHSVGGAFQTDFWCWPMFAKGAIQRGIEPAPGTQGFLCDPAHPALAEFPTEFHSNWQWWRVVKGARPIILDETPADYRPIIQVIDNFARNHKLGLLFETKVGPGKLLVCASDLPALQAHPEARQLMHSLLRYVRSPGFAPGAALDAGLIQKLLPGEIKGKPDDHLRAAPGDTPGAGVRPKG